MLYLPRRDQARPLRPRGRFFIASAHHHDPFYRRPENRETYHLITLLTLAPYNPSILRTLLELQLSYPLLFFFIQPLIQSLSPNRSNSRSSRLYIRLI